MGVRTNRNATQSKGVEGSAINFKPVGSTLRLARRPATLDGDRGLRARRGTSCLGDAIAEDLSFRWGRRMKVTMPVPSWSVSPRLCVAMLL